MIPIHAAWLIQIEVTNYCRFKCAHCTRATRHFAKPYFASLEFVEKALQSLKGWKKGVGCMGGEPTYHPEFLQICRLYKKYFPKEQCGLFTSGGELFLRYKHEISDTFGIICFNDRTKHQSYHRPPMIASEDVIKDEGLRNELIDNCWLQELWSPTITNKGCFFCEVAATFDMLFKGQGGYDIKEGWWNKTPPQFNDQVQRYCHMCGIPLPTPSLPDRTETETVSESNANRLIEAKSPYARHLRIDKNTYTKKDILKLEAEIKRPPYIPSDSHDPYAQSTSSYFYLNKQAEEWVRKQSERSRHHRSFQKANNS